MVVSLRPNSLCLVLYSRFGLTDIYLQGEYIAPEKIENVYVRSRLVAQAFVYGESLKSSLVAVIVPDQEVKPEHGGWRF